MQQMILIADFIAIAIAVKSVASSWHFIST